MSSRHPITALSRLKMEEYQKAITVLQNIVHLFRGMKIGQKGGICGSNQLTPLAGKHEFTQDENGLDYETKSMKSERSRTEREEEEALPAVLQHKNKQKRKSLAVLAPQG
ncbi:hypothetical protein JOQ06_001795 [Pogonophryne albipinna]|uniref:Uncharacterized protein n=1 Tax=Pogonophryne albipinna TaxID=1090488 RepID=A0AAD6B3E3_9TELE|nr:hypothetical protein JOQ06_001795 [Pogonophryne albipinna]